VVRDNGDEEVKPEPLRFDAVTPVQRWTTSDGRFTSSDAEFKKVHRSRLAGRSPPSTSDVISRVADTVPRVGNEDERLL